MRYCLSELLGVIVFTETLAALLYPMVIDHWLGPQFLLVPVQLVLMVWWWKCVIIHLWQAIFFF